MRVADDDALVSASMKCMMAVVVLAVVAAVDVAIVVVLVQYFGVYELFTCDFTCYFHIFAI